MTIDYITRESGLSVPQGIEVQLNERIAELEFFGEDADWLNITALGSGTTEFSQGAIQSIIRLARIMFIKNPLIQRGVKVAANYIWGRGVNISAKDELLQSVLDRFLYDSENITELTSQQSRIQKEIELRTDGNVFLVLYVHEKTGHIRVRSIPALEITEVVKDENDAKKVLYFKRSYMAKDAIVDEYYPNWRNTNPKTRLNDKPVMNAFIYHIKGSICFSDWSFALSEVYAAIDWAKAYKIFLENWSTIVASYARYAWKVSTKGGAKGIQAAKDKIGTTLSTTSTEKNPPVATGSTFIRGIDQAGQATADIEPLKTSGATTSADDGRRLLLMVAAAMGLPESFFGDVQGTYATASTLDRPTELEFVNRQTLWSDVLHDLLDFQCFWSVKAPNGLLGTVGVIDANEYGEEIVKWDNDFNPHIDIDFPAILVHSTFEQMQSLQIGANYVPNARILARIALTVLGENDIDELLDQMFPDGTDQLNVVTPEIEALRESISRLASELTK